MSTYHFDEFLVLPYSEFTPTMTQFFIVGVYCGTSFRKKGCFYSLTSALDFVQTCRERYPNTDVNIYQLLTQINQLL